MYIPGWLRRFKARTKTWKINDSQRCFVLVLLSAASFMSVTLFLDGPRQLLIPIIAGFLVVQGCILYREAKIFKNLRRR